MNVLCDAAAVTANEKRRLIKVNNVQRKRDIYGYLNTARNECLSACGVFVNFSHLFDCFYLAVTSSLEVNISVWILCDRIRLFDIVDEFRSFFRVEKTHCYVIFLKMGCCVRICLCHLPLQIFLYYA